MAVELAGRAGARAAADARSAGAAPDPSVPPALQCSAGIMAYNEEANIANAVTTVLGQRLEVGEITELVVVASGCRDRTAEIVAEIGREDQRVRLILQERREGKASAINVFIKAARSPILLMVGADVLVKDGTIDALLRHFRDPAVGMVGGHPIPVNDEGTLLGHAVHLVWRLHDQVARQSPKLGEIVAFRNVVPSIPIDTAVDEISIQAIVTQLGYQLVYEPAAIVYNRGPTTVGDFLRQRRRIYAGHLTIREQQGYEASTMSAGRVARALARSRSITTPRTALWTVSAVGLEAAARTLAHQDRRRKRTHHVWEPVPTTKHHIAQDMTAEGQNVLVFHIADFHRRRLEMGARASARLTESLVHAIQADLGSRATVTAAHSGTIVAVLSGDRGTVERTAHSLVERLSTSHFEHDGANGPDRAQLRCGILAFSPADEPCSNAQAEPAPGVLTPAGAF